jgi:MFS transporter, DHA1 family, inner membrane transport protein
MAIFKNSDINRIYMHSALQCFATNAGATFIYVYLLKAGIALPVVFLIIATVVLSRPMLRFAVVPLVVRFGLRKVLIFGTILDAASYLVLGQVHGLTGWLVFYIAASALGTTVYWTCYHSAVARLGDEEHRGAQVSAREAIYALTGIIGPLFGGLMLTFVGPNAAFMSAGFIYALAIFPILNGRDLPVEPDMKIKAAFKWFAYSFTFSDGLVAASVNFMWRIVLFKTLSESFEAFGGALALAGVAGALMGLVMGRMIDLGHHKRSYQIGIAAMAAVILAEAFGFMTPWGALLATMLSAIAGPLYMSSIMVPFYNVGKASGCTLRFNVAGENGFDSGAGLGCLIAALLTWLGVGFFWPLLIGLLGCGVLYFLLHSKIASARQ